MGQSRTPGSKGRDVLFSWEKPREDDLFCYANALPKSTTGPTIRPAKCPVECRVETQPQSEGFSELIVMDPAETAKFLAAVGANAASPIKDVLTDLRAAMTKLGFTGKAAMRTINGKEYVIISGYPGLRKFLNAPKYLASNVKVSDLVIGTGRMAKSTIKGTALSIVLVTTVTLTTAAVESILEDKEFLTKELGFTVAVDITKSVISGIAGFVAGVAVAALGAPVILPIAAGIAVGIVVGVVLDEVFPTEEIVAALTAYYDKLAESVWERGGRALHDIERQILWKIWPHQQMPFPNW